MKEMVEGLGLHKIAVHKVGFFLSFSGAQELREQGGGPGLSQPMAVLPHPK